MGRIKIIYNFINKIMNTILLCLATITILATCSCDKKNTRNIWTEKEPEKIEEPEQGDNPYEYIKSKGTIRLMTYNSFYCKGNNPDAAKNGFTEKNTSRFASVIRALKPDIISIQELDRNVFLRSSRNLLHDIAVSTNQEWTEVFGPAASFGGGQIGPGILVNKDIQIKDLRLVSIPGDEPRILIVVEFENFVFIGTHLDTNDSKRKSSAEIINDLSNQFHKPVFLAGDLNDSPSWEGGGAAFPVLKKEFSIKSSRENTLPGQAQTIDYILYDNNGTDKFNFLDTKVVKKIMFGTTMEKLDYYSDHYPVFVDIILK